MVKRHSQSLKEMQAERPWTDAEKRVIKEARTGEVELGSGALPDVPSDRVEVRAGLIRHLVLGGCEGAPVPDKGVMIIGAWVPDVLDLEGCESQQDLRLIDCRLVETPVLSDARLGAVYLPGCHVPGISAYRLRVTRDVLLNQKFTASGPVNLVGARIGDQLACNDGRFDGLGGVALDGNGMQVATSVFLCAGFHATGQVNLTGAGIGGQLACSDGRFDGAGGVALDGDAMEVGQNVHLSDGFHATGKVNLRGARVGGQLDCEDARFDGSGDVALQGNAMTVVSSVFLRDGFHATGQVALMRAQISGNLQCEGGRFDGLFDGEGMTVGAGFFWEQVAEISGPMDLTDAEVGRLHDDEQSWKGAKPLILSGFRYARLSGDMTVAQRLEWLARKAERRIEPALGWGEPVEAVGRTWKRPLPWVKGAFEEQCDPQPYTHLANVLRAQGVTQGAAQVLEVRDRKVRRASHHRARSGLDGSWHAGWASVWTFVMVPVYALFGLIFGYGHRPGRALWLVAAIWLGTFLLYGQVYRTGQMAPNSDVVLTSEAWVSAVYTGCPGTSDADYDAWRGQCALPLVAWLRTESAKDYETFSAGLYALDLFVPLDALGQESAWAPSKERGFWGALGYWMRMPVQMAGWIITAVGAAALTGLVGRKD